MQFRFSSSVFYIPTVCILRAQITEQLWIAFDSPLAMFIFPLFCLKTAAERFTHLPVGSRNISFQHFLSFPCWSVPLKSTNNEKISLLLSARVGRKDPFSVKWIAQHIFIGQIGGEKIGNQAICETRTIVRLFVNWTELNVSAGYSQFSPLRTLFWLFLFSFIFSNLLNHSEFRETTDRKRFRKCRINQRRQGEKVDSRAETEIELVVFSLCNHKTIRSAFIIAFSDFGCVLCVYKSIVSISSSLQFILFNVSVRFIAVHTHEQFVSSAWAFDAR